MTTLACAGFAAGPATAQEWKFVNATSVADTVGSISGRVNAAIPDPRNPNVMYVGTDGGRRPMIEKPGIR
jgi:hypothetical protein